MIQFENAIKRYGELILNEMKEANIICWLAGGALRDYFMGVPVKTDYDMFFPNEIEYEKARTYFKAKDCEIKWESDNGCKMKYKERTYDLVKKFFADPQTTIEAFDFTVSMFAVDQEKIYHGETTFIDLAKRQLMINEITYPASSLSRAFRYYAKGFRMCQGEMKKLFDAIQNAPKEEKRTATNTVDVKEQEQMSSGELGAFFAGID
jgi:hypothetical protein